MSYTETPDSSSTHSSINVSFGVPGAGDWGATLSTAFIMGGELTDAQADELTLALQTALQGLSFASGGSAGLVKTVTTNYTVTSN